MYDFWERFYAYVHAYLPQWQYDRDSGEVEAALLYAAAELIEDSRSRFAKLGEKHEITYLSGWPLEPQSAAPSHTYAALRSATGQPVPAGGEFYLSGNGDRRWITEADAWAGPIRPVVQVLASGRRGKLIVPSLPTPQTPTRLFDLRAPGAQRQAARLFHPDAFASEQGCGADLYLTGAGDGLLDYLCREETVKWSLLDGGDEETMVPPPRREGELLRFRLPAAPGARALQVQVRPGAPVPPRDAVGGVLVTTSRTALAAGLVCGDDGVCADDPWLPFGPVPELARTCCITCPDALSLRGARVSMSFTLAMRSKEELLPGMEGEPAYRPIMRRLPARPPEIRDVFVESVVWEYWDGAAWRPIPDTRRYQDLFQPAQAPVRHVAAQFLWPEDAAPCELLGRYGYFLRWRVQSVSGGGWLPRRCHGPEVTAVRFDAGLERAPVAVETCSGLEEAFQPRTDHRSPLFPALDEGGDGWWLGFDRPPAAGAIQLYLSLRGGAAGGRLSAWEDGARGLRPLELADGTCGLAHSGLMDLTGVRGELSQRFGRRLWWLCLRDESGRLSQRRRAPRLEALTCGAVRLRSAGADTCRPGEPLSLLRGGPVTGTTLTRSFGGVAAESDGQLLRRARDTRHHLGRAVSPLDMDQLLCGTLRDVVRTRCVVSENTLRVALLLRDVEHHGAAFALRREEAVRLLEGAGALSVLGMDLEVREASFYTVSAMVWLRPERDAAFEASRRTVQDALDRFLHPVTGHFGGDGWPLGSLPGRQETRNYLQAALPGAGIVKLLLTVTAPDGSEADGAEITDPFALPLPGRHTIREIRGEGLA